MKLFDSQLIKQWDEISIARQYKDSSELMEVAAASCVDYICDEEAELSYAVFCGIGNNGGDGLCIARMLALKEFHVIVFIIGDPEMGSSDFKKNLQLVLNTDIELNFLSENVLDFKIDPEITVIDCLFGTGINRPVEGWHAKVIGLINELPNRKIAIDLPSGLLPDLISIQTGAVVRVDVTLTFQVPKRAMLFPENYEFVGEFQVMEIGLDEEFETNQNCDLFFYDDQDASKDLKLRKKFDYKNSWGHVQVMAGSKGKMGAAILCSFAAMRTGAGLVTAVVPICGLPLLQSVIPEVMCTEDKGVDCLSHAELDEKFVCTAIGPGIGEAPETSLMLQKILESATHPLVLDADALNIIAHHQLHHLIPHGSILTPHVGEFDRCFGVHSNSFQRFETLKKKSVEFNCVIILKGAHTMVASPDGSVSFNSSGNPGMATAGSGDVLTGIVVSLMAQGYTGPTSAKLGVFIHGLAGDIAAEMRGETGMMARDIIDCLPEAINELISLKDS